MQEGFYEQVITRRLAAALADRPDLLVSKEILGKDEGAVFLSRFFRQRLEQAFEQLSAAQDEHARVRLLELTNQLIGLLAEYTAPDLLAGEQVAAEGELLRAVFRRATFAHASLKDHLQDVFPYTGLSESELFTGSKLRVSMESELKKEMLTADEIWWLVSFLKFEGVRLFEQVFERLQELGRPVRIICTVYMGITDLKAIDWLSRFANVSIKISFNTQHERLHAKAYLFRRHSGFHTAYIGSSNLSRTALTNGLEWNLKVTQQEIPHIIEKCNHTFLTYWDDPEFELYDPQQHRERLRSALQLPKAGGAQLPFFTLNPFPFQQEILDQLADCRARGQHKNLIVAATGTGKTMMAAFDFRRFRRERPGARLLFVAHRKEILQQALLSFRQVLRSSDFGQLWVDGQRPDAYHHLFASVQTLNNQLQRLALAADFYDYIVIDEVHHSAAASYQQLLQAFRPAVLLGLTATPERHDGDDITRFFGHSISAEIRLPEALNRRLLCPFQYFGIADATDLSQLPWRRGWYLPDSLEKIYTGNDRRVDDILRSMDQYLKDPQAARALGFCVTQKHAEYMRDKFLQKNYRAAALTAANSGERAVLLEKLRRREINYLFVVDMFNEGVDIPEVDTLLFLRPTQSLTIFLQQLGRGLRLHEEKEYLTVLDFVGQAHVDYSYEHKFRGMLGRTHTRVSDEIAHDFPHLPLGCSIVLQREAREYILQSIRRAVKGGSRKLVQEIRKFRQEYALPCSMANFCSYQEVSLKKIYDTGLLWFELLMLADGVEPVREELHGRLAAMLSNNWQRTDSRSYFAFVQEQLLAGFVGVASAAEAQWLLMLYYDLFGQAPGVADTAALQALLRTLFADRRLTDELLAYLQLRLEQLEAIEKSLELEEALSGSLGASRQLPYPLALRLHGRYSREQILVAFGVSTLAKSGSSREGVLWVKEKNTELLFVTLNKESKRFSPSTLYHDYFISEELFHWQSQNATSPESEKGQSYIEHELRGKQVLLFVREATRDEQGLTMAFVFCGKLRYLRHSGRKPMSIVWRLLEPPPALLLYEGKKLAVG